MDHQWCKTTFRELLEWAITAVKQIQFSYYPWRDVSSFFITILLILFKMKTSFSWYEITLFKKKNQRTYYKKKNLALGYPCDRHLINTCDK